MSIANYSRRPATQMFGLLRNPARDGFAASGENPRKIPPLLSRYYEWGVGWSARMLSSVGALVDAARGMQAQYEKQPFAVTLDAFWRDRFLFKEAMLSRSLSKWFAQWSQPVVLEPKLGSPSYRLTARCTRDAIEASIGFDLLQGSRFSLCKRADCSRPFVANRMGKKFCSYDCAHVIAVRKFRKRKA